ncbi:MAG TPA: pentapeptide repeat-containing protein [Acidimicrobiales bacterium]|nr:pentapeptide repeat-containing protein [Acidimicrobiales bacterium]
MRGARILLFVALAGGLLASCGGGPAATSTSRSHDCVVSSANTDYNGCNLAHADLAGRDLQQDSFVGADLAGANLAGANLEGADFSRARTQGVVTTKTTICVNAQYGPCTLPGLRGPKKVSYL